MANQKAVKALNDSIGAAKKAQRDLLAAKQHIDAAIAADPSLASNSNLSDAKEFYSEASIITDSGIESVQAVLAPPD